MQTRFPDLQSRPLRRASAAVRYGVAVMRFPPLRGTRMSLGPGSYLALSRGARVQVGPGFASWRDLTLIVAGSLGVGRRFFCNRSVAIVVLDCVDIGDDVRLGERVSILDHNHVIEPLRDIEARTHDFITAPVKIGSRVLIGANSVVLAGASIGADSVIGAGSVVRGEIPAGVLAAGVPATVKRPLTV